MFDVPDGILDLLSNPLPIEPTPDPLQTPNGIKSIRMLRHDAKQRFLNMMKQETLSAVMDSLPATGEVLHVVSNGKFDFWTWVPVLIRLSGGKVEHLFASTWTLSRANANEMLRMLNAGDIGMVTLLTGEEFKSRETAVYGTLVEGLLKKHQRYMSCPNHAKVLLLRNSATATWLTVEGSANFTSNPRIENYVITNERSVFEFHHAWMEEIFSAAKTQ